MKIGVKVIDNTTLQVTLGECTYNLQIDVNGNILTTTFASGTCGSNFAEVDEWEKVSDQTILSIEESLNLQENNGFDKTTLGGIVGSTL